MNFSRLIAVYLFLGGTAAATFSLVVIFEGIQLVVDQRRYGNTSFKRYRFEPIFLLKDTSKFAYTSSFILLLIGAGCLLADLGKPDMFYFVLIRPTLSIMTLGSYALMGLGLCMFGVVLISNLEVGFKVKFIDWVLKFSGLIFSLTVIAYTGFLLKSALAVHLWQSYFLVALFIFSAFSCGCAIIVLCILICNNYKMANQKVRIMSAIDICCILLEFIFLILYLKGIYVSYGMGPIKPIFMSYNLYLFLIGFVGCGIVLPVILELYFLFSPSMVNKKVLAALSSLILLGGLSLRLIVINAGTIVTF